MQLATLVFGLALWFAPFPEGLTQQAWHLFTIFITAIFAVIVNAMPILTASVLALAVSILTGTLEAEDAYSGFGSGFILLIVTAFLIGRGVVNSGLGSRIAYTLVRLFGKSTLGLGYSMVATDILIAAAFPSNTARSGVLYPIVYSLSNSGGSRPDDDTRRKMGAYLMMNSMAGLSISSTLWFTAMRPHSCTVHSTRAGISAFASSTSRRRHTLATSSSSLRRRASTVKRMRKVMASSAGA